MLEKIKYKLRALFSQIRRIKLKRSNVFIHWSVYINEFCKFEGDNRINSNSKLTNVSLGRGTYLGCDCLLTNVSFGRYCSIGPRLKIITGRHPSSDYVSTHPAFYTTQKQAGFTYVKETIFDEFKYADKKLKIAVKICNDVWIGSDVIILEGVTVGNGSIIAAGSIITKDVEPYSITGGNPAAKIRDRFSISDSLYLDNSKWWDEDSLYLKNHSYLFNNIDNFKKKWKNKNVAEN